MRACAIILVAVVHLWSSLPVRGHGDLHDQIVEVTASIKADPNNAVLYHKRGELHRAHGEFAEALSDYARAEKLNPALHVVFLSRGRALVESGKDAAALDPLNMFLAQQPEHVDGRWLRARVLARIGKRDEAERDFQKVIAATAELSPELYIERAKNLEEAGRKEAALAVIADGIQTIGSLITLELEALDLEVGMEQFQDALKRIDSLIDKAERKESFFVRKAELYEKMNDQPHAQEFYGKALAAIAALPERQRKLKSTLQLQEQIRGRMKELTRAASKPAN